MLRLAVGGFPVGPGVINLSARHRPALDDGGADIQESQASTSGPSSKLPFTIRLAPSITGGSGLPKGAETTSRTTNNETALRRVGMGNLLLMDLRRLTSFCQSWFYLP